MHFFSSFSLLVQIIERALEKLILSKIGDILGFSNFIYLRYETISFLRIYIESFHIDITLK